MAIKRYKPTTPGRRGMTTLDYKADITKTTPEKSLVKTIKKHSGRNNQGKITTRHKGGGATKKYRIIDFKRNKDFVPATVSAIEYDPNRTSNIALLNYADGEKRYILAPKGLKVGMTVVSGTLTNVTAAEQKKLSNNGKHELVSADIKVGHTLNLKDIPEGTVCHNLELTPGKGGQLARSAGASITILGDDESGKYRLVRLASGEVRKILQNCRATIGAVGNEDWSLVNWGKAGRNRHRGIRPTVRGSVMNPNDHPHGGGEGRTSIGRKAPLTPWGKKALGVKTRSKKKASTKLIVRGRKQK